MNKFKKGDKVKLKNNLKIGKSYGSVLFFRTMKNICDNKILEIKRVFKEGNSKALYGVKDSGFVFSEEMLKPIKSKVKRV